jgi:ABC-type phosphate transport system substrate-binding protein
MRKHILAVTTVATVGVLGMAGAAQARTVRPGHTGATAAQTSVTVPAGPVTGATLKCGSGTLTSFTSSPAQPTSVNALKQKSAVEFSGVWTAAGSFTVKLTCSGGSTSDTLTAESSPQPTDIAGVGAQTQQDLLDQFSADYNATVKSGPHLYYWDAINPITGAIGDQIVIKGTSADQTTCKQARPNGSSAGITALETSNQKISGQPCIDFAGSSRPRGSSDPNSISFVNLAGDAVDYATEPAAGGGKSNVPANLTTAELAAVYECKITNWDQLPGGGNGAPVVLIPQTSSGTRSFFLSAIGVTAPGACANDLPTTADPGGTLEENEGVNAIFAKNPQDVIFPYSIADYLSQAFHSGKCFSAACTAAKSGTHKGEICVPGKGQNLFGCNIHGTLRLNEINSTAPTTPFPPTATATINSAFSPTFQRTLFEVVSNPSTTGFGIPPYLQPLFGPTGYFCTNATARKDLQHYGFLPLPNGTAAGDCGFAQ